MLPASETLQPCKNTGQIADVSTKQLVKDQATVPSGAVLPFAVSNANKAMTYRLLLAIGLTCCAVPTPAREPDGCPRSGENSSAHNSNPDQPNRAHLDTQE